MRTTTQQNQHAVRVGKKRQARSRVAVQRVRANADKAAAEKRDIIRERRAEMKRDAQRMADASRRIHLLRKNMGREPAKPSPASKAVSLFRRVFPKKGG